MLNTMKKSGKLVLILALFFLFSCSTDQKNTVPAGDFSGALTQEEIQKGRLSPEILWKFGRISDHRLSPDGNTVIYGLTRYDYKTNGRITDIYRISSQGGEPVALTSSDGSYSNQRWIEGGAKIAFLSSASGTAQVWEMMPDGSGKIQLSDVEGGINGFEYSPDGTHILYLKDVVLDKTTAQIYPDLPLANVRMADDLMYRHWNNWSDGAYSHIFIAGFENGKVAGGKDIMEGEPWDAPLSPYFDQAEISFSPDGKYIAYTCKKMKGREYALSTNSDIYLYNLADGTTENLTAGMQGYDKYPVFSPDGSRLAWLSMETPGYEADKNRIFLLDLASGERKDITTGFDQNAEGLSWSADGQSIFFTSVHHGTTQVYSILPEKGEIKKITEGIHDYISVQQGPGFLSGEKMSMSMAAELFRINPTDGSELQLTRINQPIYDNIKFGRVEERWVKTTDKKDMLVWVIYPPDFDPAKKYPALLYCQGGPQSAVSQFFSFRWNFQIMAANDYIIVAPNRRGLPGFGSEWNEQISGDYGGQNIKDYLSAIDAVSNEPYVDKERLGAVGASYGGFSVFYLAGNHQGRFKALISHCGIFNFESMYGSTEEMFFVNHDLGGPYWQKPKPESFKWSPHLYADKWDTPILIISGEYDFRIPYTQSMEAFNAAQLRGIPSKLIIFPEETHFVLKPQNSILWQREFFGWLDRYLKE
jgi:dipeptidyl aminopeptidase/acylaminoacyl peptidase